ncbi:MAG: hypothetical protein SA339_08280 [Methanomassiliicoccus sp.]|nr:hypothetical protein [Methanomassiliicoccus sp.]
MAEASEQMMEVRLQIQRALDEIFQLVEEDEWTRYKLVRLAGTIASDKAYEEMLIFINYSYSDPKDVDRDSWVFRDNYNDQDFQRVFIDKVFGLMNKTLQSLDPMTRVAAMGVYPSKSKRGRIFSHCSKEYFTDAIKEPGSFGYISGPKGKPLGVGKSDFACRMMEFVLEMGQCVATNIVMKDAPPGVTRIFGLRGLVELAINNLFQGKLTFAFLDEFLQVVSKEKATKGDWVNLKKLLYLCRKIGLNIIALSQREVEVPTAIQEMGVWHVQKIEKEIMRVHFVIKGMSTVDEMVYQVPGTKLKFQTGHPGSFRLDDLDIDAMHDYLIEQEEMAYKEGKEVNAFKLILDFLNLDRSQITKQDYMAFAKICYVKGIMTQNQIAECVSLDDHPVNQSTISRWLTAMGVT